MNPSPPVPNGRDKTNGRFTSGNKFAVGRPRRRCLFDIVSERAERDGLDVEAELYAVCLTLIAAAKDGDVNAARQVLDRLTESDVQQVHVSGDGMSDVERVARLQALLEAAAARKQEGDHAD